jgi:hypothetical protein
MGSPRILMTLLNQELELGIVLEKILLVQQQDLLLSLHMLYWTFTT